MEMYGVGESLGPQLMAEIGDVRRSERKQSLVAFAGIDPAPSEWLSRILCKLRIGCKTE